MLIQYPSNKSLQSIRPDQANDLAYTELDCMSHYSFLQSATAPEQLIQRAFDQGYRSLTITDECSLAGVAKAFHHVRNIAKHFEYDYRHLPFRLLIGSSFVLDDCRFILIVRNQAGYQQLVSLITNARRRADKGSYQIRWQDLQYCTECIAIMTPPLQLLALKTDQHQHQQTCLQQLASCFKERCFLSYQNLLQGHQKQLLTLLRQWSNLYQTPLVASGRVAMDIRTRKPLYDVLLATHYLTTIDKLGYLTHCNGEQYLRSLKTLKAIYPIDCIQQTQKIAEQCTFDLGSLRYQYPQEVIPPGKTAPQYLRELVERGVQWRWPHGVNQSVRETIEKELLLIAEMDYESYFLTIYDIVDFARQQGIYCQGRGSAANSVICYCLGITEVNPERVSLLFERFISKERDEPPDIDVDFEHERREEVIQHIYKKYGRHRAALAAAVVTYRPKSAIRDVGKALGIDHDMLDQLSRSMAWWDNSDARIQRLKESGICKDSHTAQYFVQLVSELLNTPRHLSQHVGGFIIAKGPLTELVPIENASMPDRTIIQWDKDDLESMGLLKVDILALGMLTAIRKATQYIASFHNREFTPLDIPQQDDPKVFEQISAADTVGVFQIESRAQMSMLPRLKPRNYYDLVIQVAIVRPGPIQGDMVHPYLRRRDGLEAVNYPSEAIKSVLQRTLGVPIFQEQVIQLAMVAAGFSGGEADALRRAMAAWKRKGGLEPYRDKLVNGMAERGYPADFALRIFEQIKGFGEYGFPESHAASFALLAYQSAWLKHYHPAAFCCALLNSLPMGFYSASQLIQDVRRHGVEVLPVDVCLSDYDTKLIHSSRRFTHSSDSSHQNHQSDSIQYQPAIRLGLRIIKGLEKQLGQRIAQLAQQQSFNSLESLSQQAHIPNQQLKKLAQSGALQSLSQHKRDALWQVLAIEKSLPLAIQLSPSQLSSCQLRPSQTSSSQTSSSQANPLDAQQPTLSAPSDIEDMIADYQHTGLSLQHHPMALIRHKDPIKKCLRAVDIMQTESGRLVTVAGVVTNRQRPSTAGGVLFITLEDETGFLNLVLWQSTVEAQRKAIMGSKILKVKGILERKDEVTHIIAGKLIDCSHLLNELQTQSRDFH
jgi:error-prone DNA polymerase